MFVFVSITVLAKPAKDLKTQTIRVVNAYSSGTDSIDVTIGSGSGYNEEIMNMTFSFHPDSSNWYQLYLGFFGITFDEDSGEVHQSRHIQNRIRTDGELLSVDSMGTNIYEQWGIDFITGKLGDNTVGTAMADTLGAIPIEIEQRLLVRENSADQFFFLEYHVFNNDSNIFIDTTGVEPDTQFISRTLHGAKTVFFADIDAGYGAEDNYTGIDSSRNLIYEYGEGDYYCGFAPLIPDESPQYGNYYNWYDYGTDNKIDSLVNSPNYNAAYENSPGDYSSYLVAELGNLAPIYKHPDSLYFDPDTVIAAYIFALGHDMNELQTQIDLGRTVYFNYSSVQEVNLPADYDLMTVFPNPFNSSALITLALDNTARGSVKVFDVLGREVVTLHSGYLYRGMHEFRWKGITDSGTGVAAGIYFVQAKFSDFEETKKLIYLP